MLVRLGRCCIPDVVCTGETKSGKAIFVEIEGEKFCIPNSQVHEDSEVWKNEQEGMLVISEWIAKQNGII